MTALKLEKLLPKQFPPRLREIADPPKQLFLEGELPDPEVYIYLTVVGSRRASVYGRDVCEKLIGALAGEPVAIISGLAIGLDTIAHQAAIENNLITVAVPGSGLDRSTIHPPSNKKLADKIVESGGALLSELEPKMPAGIHTFPQRNRIMAGLSQAILVVEAGEKSGTLITCRLALDYNRDVLAVPGPIFSPNSMGTNKLIRAGATPITSATDLLEALGLERKEARLDLGLEVSGREKQIVDLLALAPRPRDEIIRELAISPQETSVLLMSLEIKGVIKESLGVLRLV